MKRFLSLFLSLLTLTSMLLCSLPVSAKCIEDPYSQFIDDPYYEVTSDYVTGIISKLENLTVSGSVCIDYLAEEILLHRALIFISANIIGYTNNPELIDITDDIISNYTAEIREMREELSSLINSYKGKEISKEDTEYIKEYKVIINELSKKFSEINIKNKNELTYIKEAIALLEASKQISLINTKCDKSDLVKKITKNELMNTEEYISRLKTLEVAFE